MLLDELVVQMNVNGDTKPLERALLLLEKAQAAYKKIIDNPALDIDGSPAIKSLQQVQRQMNKLNEKINQKRIIRIEQEEQKQNMQGLKDAQAYLQQAKEQYELEERYSIKLANGKKIRLDLDAALARTTIGATNKVAALKQELMGLAYANPVLSRLIGSLGMFAAMTGASIGLQQYIAISDQWKTIGGQIKNVSKSLQEAENAELELYNIASRTRQSYQSTAELYTSVSRNAAELGKDSGEILKFTEDVSNAMLLGGSSAQAQSAALVQLGQALGSGVLRGDELNSILEQAPRLAKAIAAGMDTSVGNLRALGAKGEITSQKLFEAIRKQSEKLKKELGNTPWTVEQAKTKVQNSLGMLFYTIEKKMGIGSKIAQGIAKVSEILEKINNIVAKIPAEDLQNMMKALALYAGVFYVYTKRAAIVNTFMASVGAVKMLVGEFRAATTVLGGLRAMIAAVGATGAASSVIATGGLILVVALIVFLILLIQDFYVWVNGGESVLGDTFGSWTSVVAEFSKRWEQWKTEFGKSIEWLGQTVDRVGNWIKQVWQDVCAACSAWLEKGIISKLKDVLDLVIWIIKYMTPLGWAFQGISWALEKGGLLDPKNLPKAPDVNPFALGVTGGFGGTNNNMNNSGNVTNYNNFNIKSSTPEAVAKEIGSRGSFGGLPQLSITEWGFSDG